MVLSIVFVCFFSTVDWFLVLQVGCKVEVRVWRDREETVQSQAVDHSLFQISRVEIYFSEGEREIRSYQ